MNKIYLFLGADGADKDARIDALRTKHFSVANSQNFDYEALYSAKLDPWELKKSLLTLPAVAAQRLLLIHYCHKLIPRNKEIILEFAASDQEHVVLVMESSQWGRGDSFVKKLAVYAKIEDMQKSVGKNVFDMTRLLSSGRKAEALKVLYELLSVGIHPLQIMGGLVWFWGKQRGRIKVDIFEQGLLDRWRFSFCWLWGCFGWCCAPACRYQHRNSHQEAH